ncbi:MAG: transglutaminase-like domain-containing protein [Bacteroidales bacterium]|jgi:transglutaminase-like putative cysteine protease|nr:transglutaminase-like domain-containing protein [Bacteroidales bacterium]
MKRFYYLLSIVISLTACSAKTDRPFLIGDEYREKVQQQFGERKRLAQHRAKQLFSVFDHPLTTEQREALEFLYAYMPLSDLADYDGDFFLKQVNAAFRARDYFAWGKTVPEDIFRHFVLVYRVNNENQDTARLVFFNELKDRVKGLSMADAALEVNHWCHEKVTYRGTDVRTSAPLALMRTGWGRCGEESTFTVTAMRAVGIPARQCYTPRWVHTDDNHAWVEVWVDGQWHYLGACEPEPELDMAWFTAPAKRAMMVHTNVFGLYDGPEEKNIETSLYSKINLLPHYAATRILSVKVVDSTGKPVEDAKVQYKVYNYAELYPVADGQTGTDGTASVITGLGDLIVWASRGNKYGYEKAAAGNNSVTVALNRKAGAAYDETCELVPPVEQKIKQASAGKQAQNARRLAQEDSIRNAYMATFANEEQATALAKEIDEDSREVWKYLQRAQGNWREIETFVRQNAGNPYLWPFIASLTEKDARDTPAEYLADYLDRKRTAELTSDKTFTKEFLAAYVLSPRIGREPIRPWRSFFRTALHDAEDTRFTASGAVSYVKENIRPADGENYYNCPLSPQGVAELKLADKYSRNIFFVALCRAAGLPARIEQATDKPQYFEDGTWKDAVFETTGPEQTAKGKVVIDNSADNAVKPQYSTHFTLARFSNGDFVTLDYEEDPALKNFPCTLTLDTGYYRLMTGSRAHDGSVTVHTDYFTLAANRQQKLTVTLPKVSGKMQVMGIVDMNTVLSMTDGSHRTLKEISNGKGVMLCFIDPGKEPSKHVLQDLPALQNEFEQWGGGVLWMTPSDKMAGKFDLSVFAELPKQSACAVDNKRTLLKGVSHTLQLDFTENFPLTLFLSDNGGILFFSEGYRIGIGERIIKTIRENQE